MNAEDQPRLTSRRTLALLATGLAAYGVACVLTGPIGVTVVDEVHYYTEALAISHRLPLGTAQSYALANGMVPFQGPLCPPGWPAILAPFTRLTWPGPFAAAAVLHALSAMVLAALFWRRGLSPLWGLLLLAQPTLLAFSRSMMAEPLAVFQTTLLLWAAEIESPLLLGLIAGCAPLIKLSQVLAAAPFVAVWLWRHGAKPREVLLVTLGALPGLALMLWFNRTAYGHLLATGYTADYASPSQAFVWLGLGLAQLFFAWPGLPMGVLRARGEEIAGALAVVLYLSFYGYHYQGPNLLATLVVGARIHSSAIVLLLPGYAALLSSLKPKLRELSLAALLLGAIVAPFAVLGAVSRWRSHLDNLREATLANLRDCPVGYSTLALKLLVPIPSEKRLHGPEDLPTLDGDLQRGQCVDLIDPLSEPSTYRQPPVYSDAFAPLLERWPNRDATADGGTRVIWIDPR